MEEHIGWGDFEVIKWGASHKGMKPFLSRTRLDEMVKKWAREMFIFQAVVPAEKFIGFSMLESQS